MIMGLLLVLGLACSIGAYVNALMFLHEIVQIFNTPPSPENDCI